MDYTRIIGALRNLPPEFTAGEAAGELAAFYRTPQKALEYLVKTGYLLRLKRGLYAIRKFYDPIAAAGSLHGPSYISFETALGIYGMIPEHVPSVISVVDGRQLKLAVGKNVFVYRSQNRELFARGMTAMDWKGRNLLIATREKALLDTLAWQHLKCGNSSDEDIFRYVMESFRFDEEVIDRLCPTKLSQLAPLYRNLAPRKFVNALSKMGNKDE